MLALLPLLVALVTPAPQPSAGCARETIEHGRRLERTLRVDGVPRQVILDVPDTVRARTPAPLLLDFHGFGHSGAGMWEASGFRALAARDGFITAYPDGLPVRLPIRGITNEAPGWRIDTLAGNRDVAFVRALLDDLEARYCVDRARIYATGFSNGAFFSQLLACAMAERIAAVASVGGGTLPVDCRPARPVPILIQHGSADALIPPAQARAARDAWKAINGCDTRAAGGDACERWGGCRDNVTVAYCEEPHAHTWPPQATARVWSFLRRWRAP